MAKKGNKPNKAFRGERYTPVYLSQYEITYEPMEERRYRRLPKFVKERLERLYQDAQRKPGIAIEELLELKRKYPGVPQIYNYLAVAYSRMGEVEKAEAITRESIEKNPDYLFAKINYAEFCLRRGEYEKIPEIFKHCYDLKMLYPNRKRFHIAEFANFMGIMGLYFARTGQRELADKYNEILQDTAADFPIAKRLKRELHPSMLRRVVQRLLG